MTPRPANDATLTRSEVAATWCLRISEGQLSAEHEAEFQAWFAADPRNREAFAEAATTWSEFEGAETAPEFISHRVEALQSVRRASRPSRRWLGTAITTSFALLVLSGGAGAFWWMQAPADYRTGLGERRVVVLSDGSKVSLDAATEVKIRFDRNHRDLQLLQGRAKFEVAKDPLRPFAVAVADKVVVATGTQFSVELLQKRVHVILYEGHVAVLSRAEAHGLRPFRLRSGGLPADQLLTPGRELVAAIHSERATVEPTDPSRTLTWEAGQLSFADEPLPTAVERVNRYSREQLAVGDASASRIRVSGVFNAGDTQAFVDGVSSAFPVRVVDRDGAKVFVSAAKPKD